MALSVPNSNGGAGLSGLLRQARPAKADEPAAGSPTEPTPTAMVRPTVRAGIDSTQRGTAQITAALTVYLSALGGDDGAMRPTTAKAAAHPGAGAGAADLLRALDSYRAPAGLRLTA